MNDGMTSLAFSVYSNKGVYALLLGSGISRAASIPTGWEIVTDLVRKVAAVEGEDCGTDPAAWHQNKFGEPPHYSRLLDRLAKTQAERQQLLRGYFEPTEEDREQGRKNPTAAHKAIANMIAMGQLRVVLTTNFDRLLERALDEIGVVATVVASADQIQGSLPLVHSGPTIIKLHGDYLDTRILNTESELDVYEVSMNSLLDRVLDEYGLIICGWSGDWDIALRTAIERCPSFRFTTFWATRQKLKGIPSGLLQRRKGKEVNIQDADTFFGELEQKVRSLAEFDFPHPLSSKIWTATVKRYLVDNASRIRLHDAFRDLSEELVEKCNAMSMDLNVFEDSQFAIRIKEYEVACEVPLAVALVTAHWGSGHNHRQVLLEMQKRLVRAYA